MHIKILLWCFLLVPAFLHPLRRDSNSSVGHYVNFPIRRYVESQSPERILHHFICATQPLQRPYDDRVAQRVVPAQGVEVERPSAMVADVRQAVLEMISINLPHILNHLGRYSLLRTFSARCARLMANDSPP